MSYYEGWPPYVPVAERRRKALKKMAQLSKKGVDIRPIKIAGRHIAKTFWGQAWCDHLESLGDFENRLPRGRTYVRNGSVCHLAIEKGCVKAMVSGSILYNIKIKIDVLPKKIWTNVKARCAGQIGSLLELLQGRLSDQVMGVVTDASDGLFPSEDEIHLDCSCPDWATMCKHVAAVLYGVGARLDEQPDLLFLLRGVKHDELISANAEDAVNRATRRGGKRPTLDSSALGEVFGIELGSPVELNGNSPDLEPRNKSPRKKSTAQVIKKKATTPRHEKSLIVKNTTSKSVTKKSAVQPTKTKIGTKTGKKDSAKNIVTPQKPRTTTKKKAAAKPTKRKPALSRP